MTSVTPEVSKRRMNSWESSCMSCMSTRWLRNPSILMMFPGRTRPSLRMMVEKPVDLDDVPGQDPALLADALLEGRESLAHLCHADLLLNKKYLLL